MVKGDYILLTKKITTYKDLTINKLYEVKDVTIIGCFFIVDDVGDKVTIYTTNDPDFEFLVIDKSVVNSLYSNNYTKGFNRIQPNEYVVLNALKNLNLLQKSIIHDNDLNAIYYYVNVCSSLLSEIKLSLDNLKIVLKGLGYIVY